MSEPANERGLYGQRPSKCHDASRRAQFAREAAMTPVERAVLALYLEHRHRYFMKAFGLEESCGR